LKATRNLSSIFVLLIDFTLESWSMNKLQASLKLTPSRLAPIRRPRSLSLQGQPSNSGP